MSDQEQVSTAVRPTDVVTTDMQLPAGSAVIQAILHRDPQDPSLASMDFRFLTIGSLELNPGNPTHRFVQAVQRRMHEIMAEVTGGEDVGFGVSDDDAIEQRLRASQSNQAAIAKASLRQALLSKGMTPEDADEMIAGITDVSQATAPADKPLIDADASPLVAQARAAQAAGEQGNAQAIADVTSGSAPATDGAAAGAGSSGTGDGLLPVFMVESKSDGDVLYVAAPTMDRAKELLTAKFGPIPEHVVEWSETKLRGEPEGVLEDMGLIPE